MLKKHLLLISVTLIPQSFCMDWDSAQRLLAIDAKPIHEALTTALKDEVLNESFSRFVKSFSQSDMNPSILFNLQDKRDSKEYKYVCAPNQEYKIEYYEPNQEFSYWHSSKNKKNIMLNNVNNSVQGIPLAIEINEQNKKRRITFIDNDNLVWVNSAYTSDRTYNLIRLLFDCNRVQEVETLLSSANKILTISPSSKTLQSFEKMYERLNKTNKKNYEMLLKLRGKLKIEESNSDFECTIDCCNLCLNVTQLVFLYKLVTSGQPRAWTRPTAFVLPVAQIIKNRNEIKENAKYYGNALLQMASKKNKND